MSALETIIVGFDGSPSGVDALKLAARLGHACDARIVAAFVYRVDPLAIGDEAEWRGFLREVAERELQAAVEQVPDVEVVAVGAPSVPRGLHELAVDRRADLVVVGGSHRGAVGRIIPGSTAQRLLDGAPCPVAVAPPDDGAGAPTSLVVAGFDGEQDSRGAVALAGALARSLGVGLRIVAVAEGPDLVPPAPPYGFGASTVSEEARGEAFEEGRDTLRRGLEEAARSVSGADGGDDLEVETLLVAGRPADALRDNTPQDTGLLVVGSRGYGPVGAVLMGSVAAEVVREAHCPVVVVPRPRS